MNMDNFQPIRVVHPPRPKRFNFLAGYAAGLFGGAALLATGLLLLNFLFPPARLNVLLLGADGRATDNGVARTDTLILATVNQADSTVGLLSIPRDLWVRLPDGSDNRINTAHFFAEANVPGSGPLAAVQTVSSNFGVTLQRYARIDFSGFVRIVDSVGGVTVDVKAPIVDYEYPTADYGTEEVRFDAGVQHMNGAQALQYARIRHGSSDFARAERQQALIAALTGRLLEPGAWPRLPFLLAAIRSSVETNLTPVEIVRALPTLLRVGPQGIERRVIDDNMVQAYTTASGASVQLPVWSEINPVLLEMFGE